MLRVSPDTEVLGVLVRVMTSNLQTEELRPFLSKFNIEQFQDKDWYRVADLVEMTEQLIQERRAADAMFDLVAVGMSAVNFTPFPPELDTIEKLIDVWESRHKILYRGTDPGHLKLDCISSNHIKLHVRNPWPDDINYGSVYANVKRVCSPRSTFKVYYDPVAPRANKGAAETIFHVQWK